LDDGEGGVGRIVVDVVRAMRRTANEKGPYTTMNKDARKKTGKKSYVRFCTRPTMCKHLTNL